MSKIEVNTVAPQCGTTLTLGESGDTVTLGSGASQSGFGRTGTVDWQTTKKTTAFTAANGEGYFVDTAASGAVTMTLPSSPSAGNIVAVKDYNGNFGVANLTIGRGGSPINGGSDSDVVIDTAGASIVLVYVDATQGWVATQDDESVFSGETFLVATGGNTVATCGNFKIHTFTSPGTFTVCSVGSPANNVVDYLVVAGGGGGPYGGSGGGGGGGAGGFRASSGTASGSYTAGPGPLTSPVSALPVSATGFPIQVGGGGPGGPSSAPGNASNGTPSIFSTVTSTGGGQGGGGNAPGDGGPGGSGGGGKTHPSGGAAVGSGNTPSTTPSQGSDGGTGYTTDSSSNSTYRGGGGGGATAVGSSVATPVPSTAGPGGAGATSCITASPVNYSAGGGGGSGKEPGGATVAAGSAGGPGAAAGGARAVGNNAPNNQGGGGGGGGYDGANNAGGNGGSGIVVIRYKFQ